MLRRIWVIFLVLLSVSSCKANEELTTQANISFEEGMYYAYKICSKNGANCTLKQPQKNLNQIHEINLEKGHIPNDELYFYHSQTKNFIFFAQTFAEGVYHVAWGYVDVDDKKGRLMNKGNIYQIAGDGMSGKFNEFFTPNGSIVSVDDKQKLNPFEHSYLIPYLKNSSTEIVIDCKEYSKLNQAGYPPISNLCATNTSKVWLKKISELGDLKESSLSANVKFSKVYFGGYRNVNSSNSCSWEYSPMEYCDKKHISLYERALSNGKANFNQHYIVLPILEFPEYNQYSLVIIDQNTGTVYPLPFDWYEGKKGVKQPVQFSLDSNQVCINGSIHHWRIDEEGKACFQFDGEKFIGHKTNYMN